MNAEEMHAWNATHPGRVRRWSHLLRPQQIPPVPIRQGVNQYTNGGISANLLDSTYQWLVSNCTEVIDDLGVIRCLKPDDTRGIYRNDANEYRRINLLGNKIQCHAFVWLYQHPGVSKVVNGENWDVSHLCHNQWCCQPAHLILENHEDNIARNRCTGYMVSVERQKMTKLCSHNPSCLSVAPWRPLIEENLQIM